MFVLMKSGTSSKMVHVGLKTRSLSQMSEEPCMCSRGYIFSQMTMKLGQNVCLDEIFDDFENGSCRVKKKVTSSNLRKTFYMLWRPHFQSSNHETLSECLRGSNLGRV